MKKPNKKTVLFVSVLVIACLGIWTLWGNTALEVNEYEIVSDRIPQNFDGFRIAQVSDLHNAEFGEGNEKLIQEYLRYHSYICEKPAFLGMSNHLLYVGESK